jgi:hypothetical protein
MVVRASVPIVGGTKVQRADAIMHEGGWSRCVLLYPMNYTGEQRQFHKRLMTGQNHDNCDKLAAKVNSIAASTANFERLFQNSTRLLWLIYAVTSASWNMVAEHFDSGH